MESRVPFVDYTSVGPERSRSLINLPRSQDSQLEVVIEYVLPNQRNKNISHLIVITEDRPRKAEFRRQSPLPLRHDLRGVTWPLST